MNSDTDWSITQLFPRFGEEQLKRFQEESTPEERAELDSMFEVVEVIDEKFSNYVVSTSLYCRPHNPDQQRIHPITLENLQKPNRNVRNGQSWWETYLQPLLRDLDRIQPPWNLRLHLAEELKFLIPHLQHPRVEFRIMKHPSEFTIPGMLWRYLPLEDGVTLLARGADSLWPYKAYWDLVQGFSGSSCRFFRRFLPRDLDRTGSLVYRTIPGPLLVKEGEPLPYTEFAKAWIWFQKNDLWPRTARLAWLPGEVSKFGLEHWAKYGQDEQFLSHWLYHLACEEGLYTAINEVNRSVIIDHDRCFVESHDPEAVFVGIPPSSKPSSESAGREPGLPESQESEKPRPVFVVGKPRSGTTFMWSFLVGFEERVEPYVRSDFQGKGRRFLPDGKWATSETGCFVQDFDKGVVSLAGALAVCRKPILVEKSPAHTKLIHKVAQWFPDAKFLCMSRPIDERYESFNRHWPVEEEKFHADDREWDPPEGTMERLKEEGRLMRVPFAEMKDEETLRRVSEFVFGSDGWDIQEAFAYAESRPVGLPWVQEVAEES